MRLELKYRLKNNIFNLWMLFFISIILIYLSIIQISHFNENSLLSISKNLLLSIIIIVISVFNLVLYDEDKKMLLCIYYGLVTILYIGFALVLVLMFIAGLISL